MKRIALLGARGQLGSDIIIEAADYQNIDILPLTRDNIDIEKPDFLDRLSLYRSLDGFINCISYHRTDECEKYPEKTFYINGFFVLHLSRFCAENGQLLVQVSSDYVFNGRQNTPYLENDPIDPVNIYGASKAISEFFVKQYCPLHYIVRVSSLFGMAGASGKGGNFVETMLRLARENKPIKVVADQYMSPTHSADAARAILKLINHDSAEYGVYHSNNSGSCSWYEFAASIFKLCEIDADLASTTSENYKSLAARPRYSALDNRKLSAVCKMPEWKEALKAYLKAKGYLKMAVNS